MENSQRQAKASDFKSDFRKEKLEVKTTQLHLIRTLTQQQSYKYNY